MPQTSIVGVVEPGTRFGWQDRAACRESDPTLFYGPINERGFAKLIRIRAAKQICAGCDVIDQCARHAEHAHEGHGIWGGKTEQERGYDDGKLIH